MISQLVRLSEVLVTFGLTAQNVLLPFLYITVPFLPTIIPMAFLFAVMLTYSRLSSDGELTALLASGYSLQRISAPVVGLSLILYGAGALSGVHLEAWGRREFVQFIYQKTQTEVDNMVRFKIQPGVFLNDFLGYVFYTEKVSNDRNHYTNVMLTPGNSKASPFIVISPRGQIIGSVEEGNLRMILFDGISYSVGQEAEESTSLTFKRAEIDILRVFQEKILGADIAKDDYRSYTLKQLTQYIDTLKTKKNKKNSEVIRKASYLYHSRFSNSFIIIAFALFAIVLGIHPQRHGKSSGYLGAVSTIITCFVILVATRWLAENGYASIFASTWLPQFFILGLAAFAFYQRARLPPSEPIFSIKNLPFVRKKISSR